MAKWRCTNAKPNGQLCNLTMYGGENPPNVPVCSRCRKKPTWARGDGAPVAAAKPAFERLGAGWRCKRCGQWVTGPTHFCLRDLEDDYARLLNDPLYRRVAKGILNFRVGVDRARHGGLDAVTMGRINRVLRMLIVLHHNADHIAKLAEEQMPEAASAELKTELMDDLNTKLKSRYADNADVIGEANYGGYASKPGRLAGYFRLGWDAVAYRWPQLKEQDLKEDYLKKVFEHDKGYPQTVNSAYG